MKYLLTSCLLCLGLNSMAFGASEVLAQCTVNHVDGGSGARINLLRTANGELRANFLTGTTVSGTSYRVSEVAPRVYQGSIRDQGQFTITLRIGSRPATNPYINGYASTLEIVYPDLNAASGSGYYRSSPQDGFVCGEKISHF